MIRYKNGMNFVVIGKEEKRRKRILSLFVSLAMLLGMMPAAAFAADVEGYGVYINGEEFTATNLEITDGTDGTATLTTGAEYTLTLNNFNFNGAGHKYEDGTVAAIYSDKPLHIILKGSNSVKLTPTKGIENNIIYCKDDISFSGDDAGDSLEVNFNDSPATTGSGKNAVIYSDGSVSVSGSCMITFFGTGSDVASYGIYSSEDISFSGNCSLSGYSSPGGINSYIVYSSGAIQAGGNAYLIFKINNSSAGDTEKYTCGMYSEKGVTISDNVELSIMTNGGAVTNYGMYSLGDVTISSSNLVECFGEAAGLYSNGNVTFKDDTPNDNTLNSRQFGGKSADGYGIHAAKVTINDGYNVTAQGGKQAFNVKPNIVERSDNNIWELTCGDDVDNKTNMPIEEMAEAYRRKWVSINLVPPVASDEVSYIAAAYVELQNALDGDDAVNIQSVVDMYTADYNGRTFSELLENMTLTDKKALAITMGDTMSADEAYAAVKAVYERALRILGEEIDIIAEIYEAYVYLRDAVRGDILDVLQAAVNGFGPLADSFYDLDDEQLAELAKALYPDDTQTGQDVYNSIDSDWLYANNVVDIYELYQAYVAESNESTASPFVGSYEDYNDDPYGRTVLEMIRSDIWDFDDVYEQARATLQGNPGGGNGGGSSTSVKADDDQVTIGTSSSSISAKDADKAIDKAVDIDADKIVIDTNKGKVTLPEGMTDDIVDKTDADLVVETKNGTVTIPNSTLEDLDAEGKVTIEVTKDKVTISDEDGKLSDIGKMKVTVPYEENNKTGNVAVEVTKVDGTKEVIENVYDGKDSVTFTVDGSVTFKIIDDYIPLEDVPVVPEQPAENPFRDVSETDWFYNAVMYVSENGLMSGVDADNFGPYGNTTRGMITTILWRMEDKPAAGAVPFEDVKTDMYYADAIAWAAENGIVSGYDADTFSPDDPITREQLASILYRYAKYKGEGFEGLWAFHLDFTDVAEMSEYAYEPMCWCVMNGIISGNDDGTLNPAGHAQRAHAAQMLMQFLKDKITK